ncbi:unnamed protein product [Rotaria socialis]|uniref:Uncharacterized protein n=1 Tax=Rotaria socialis TaxID=392032 RepID=A0A818H222_9BILA|nr:unnamed protein product [Rotaria socialis]
MVNMNNQYFNNSDSLQEHSATTSRFTVNATDSTSQRPSFPRFRLTFATNETLSELSIIKYTNKYCQIGLSYGRNSGMGRNKSFLLYANSSKQFDRLMDKNIWPTQICSFDFSIGFPSKVPSSYSIVVIGIPVQGN